MRIFDAVFFAAVFFFAVDLVDLVFAGFDFAPLDLDVERFFGFGVTADVGTESIGAETTVVDGLTGIAPVPAGLVVPVVTGLSGAGVVPVATGLSGT